MLQLLHGLSATDIFGLTPSASLKTHQETGGMSLHSWVTYIVKLTASSPLQAPRMVVEVFSENVKLPMLSHSNSKHIGPHTLKVMLASSKRSGKMVLQRPL